MAAYTDLLRELTGQILDRALPMGEFDFVDDVAAVLPIRVLCEILGVPLEDNGKLIEWGDAMIGSTDPDLSDISYEHPSSEQYRLLPFRSPVALELYRYGHALAAERRKDPRDDIVTKLVEAEIDGERLTEQEFDAMFLLLVVAGNETTRQAIAHGMQAFMDFPEELERLRADPALMTPAVEEIIRWATPVLHFRRTATRDVELRGAEIREGDKVVTWYASANFDERVFDDPLRFDVGRKPERPRQLRPRRPALLPGRASGEARGQDHVRGAAPADRLDRAGRPAPAHSHQLHQRPQGDARARRRGMKGSPRGR